MHLRYPLCFVCALACAHGAFAQSPETPVTQEITVHVAAQRLALAVAPVQTSSKDTAQKVDGMLAHALSLTGLFDVVPQASFLPGLVDEKLDATQFDRWYASGAQVLIKAEAHTQGNAMTIDFGLFDVVGNKRIDLKYDAPRVTTDKPGPAIYAFVNAVVAYFTGAPGFLGQSLLAISRQGRGKGARVVSMLTDGTQVARVTRSETIEILPTWGPGGSVLLTSYAHGNPDLYAVSNGAGKRISSHPGMNSGADYCPANGRIALTLSKDGNAEIYTMNVDGSGLTRLTDHRAIDTSPSWSPDCAKIAFVSDRGGNPQIYTMNADGSAVTRLTTLGKYNANPDWGKHDVIAFSARDEQNNLDIFTIRADGSDLNRITQQQGKNDKPTWSPDGRYIAFSSTRDSGSRIYISTADGKSQAPVTSSGWYENPVWGH